MPEAARPLISDPVRARRLARAIVSDVLSYNENKVRAGIECDDLFERMDKEIQAARSFFGERVTPELCGDAGVFERALVDVLVYGSRALRNGPW